MQMRQRLPGTRRWIIDHAPIPLLTHAHELFLSGAVFLIGMALVFGDVAPGSVTSQVPAWQSNLWALTLFIGSGLTIWGLFGNRPRLEWSGQILLGYGCAFYAAALAIGIPLNQSGVVFAIYTGLSAVSFWRAFNITSAPLVQKRLTLAARHAHIRATMERQERDTR